MAKKIIEIKDQIAYYKLFNCQPTSYTKNPFEDGSEQFKQLIKDDMQKIKMCSPLIIHEPTFYHAHKDGYIDVECKIRGGDLIIYRFYPYSTRNKELTHKVVKVQIEQLFTETIVFVDENANETEMEHSARLAARSAVRYKWEEK